MDEVIIPDVIEPILGWRSFHYGQDNDDAPWWPCSTTRAVLWYEGELEAKCDARGEHKAPQAGCTCGIYVSDKREVPADYSPILAVVELWGTVVKHDKGYRAQKARIKMLWSEEELTEIDEQTIREMCDRMNVPRLIGKDALADWNV